MKRIIALILCLVFITSFCACGKTKPADGPIRVPEKQDLIICDDVNQFDYIEVDGGISIILFKNYDNIKYDKIIVPNEIDGKTVVGIGLKERQSNSITHVCGNCEVILPDTVEFIGQYAFAQATPMVKVSGAKNCKEICDFAFCNCENLKEITFLDNVEIISDSAFVGCDKFTQTRAEKPADTPVKIPEKQDLKICDDVSLFDYEEIDNGITIIHFRNHNYEEYDKIIVPSEIDGKKVIGIGLKDEDSNAMTGVCGNCEVVLPETVEFIGRYAFDGARGLVKLSGAENCREILDFAFSNCENLKEVTFIDSVETVSDSAFIGCTNFTQK